MDIPNWRAIISQKSDFPGFVELAGMENEQEFYKVYEAWKVYSPEFSGAKIAEIAGVKATTTRAYITQLNATGGNAVTAKLRLRLYTERSNLRRAYALSADPEIVAKLIAVDAKLTKEIDRLRTVRPAPRTPWAHLMEEKRIEAEWQASGIPD